MSSEDIDDDLQGDDVDKTRAQKEKREQDPIVSQYQIDNNEMLRLKQFYDSDVEIQTCRERKKIETFRHKCTIAWWYMNDAVQLGKVPYFHQEQYMNALQDMMIVAQDYLTLFRYVAFYYVRDMISWVLRDDGSLPFGVVELGLNRNDIAGTFYSVRRDGHFKRELIYKCQDEAINERYEFYVFDQVPTFCESPRLYGGCSQNTLVPSSPFSELIDDRNEIYEAKVCLGDANFMATHPEGFIYSKPLPDTNIENIPEAIRYAEEDIASASQATSLQRAHLTTSMAGSYINKFRQTGGTSLRGLTTVTQDKSMVQQMFLQSRGGQMCGPNAPTPTLYHERQAAFMRPSVKESLEELPSYMEVSRGPSPAALINPNDLLRRYEDKVCQLMNFPHLYFKPNKGGADSRVNGAGGHTGGGSGGNNSAGSIMFAQKQLTDAVCEQQAVFAQIFGALYELTFATMDRRLFALLPEEYRDVVEHVSAHMRFDNQITKSDEAIHGLLPFYKEGIVNDSDIRKLLSRNFGLLENEEEETEKNNSKKKKPRKKKPKKPKKAVSEESADNGDNDNDNEKGGEGEEKTNKEKEEEEKKEEKKRKRDDIEKK